MIEQLAQHNHCISIKLPGHGGAPDPDDFSDPTVETELSILEQVVNQFTAGPIHLVGHSYGGVVALAQALKGNLPLSQLTLFEPVAVWVLDVAKNEELNDRVQKFLAKYRHNVVQKTPYVCGQVIDFWAGDGVFESLPDFIKNSMVPLVTNNLRHWDICTTIRSSLRDVQQCLVPTRLVCGTGSNPLAHAISDHLSEELPNSKKFLIEGASHFLVTSHFEECLSVLQNPFVFQ